MEKNIQETPFSNKLNHFYTVGAQFLIQGYSSGAQRSTERSTETRHDEKCLKVEAPTEGQ